MKDDQIVPKPGLIVLFGSGETSPSGRKIFDWVFRRLPNSPHIALLETPSGFELNSHHVIKSIADFFIYRLQNYSPQVEIIPARKRGTKFSPDEPSIVAPLLNADLIFMGPGSPSYAVRQLRDSLAWNYLIARHYLGATLALASAATVAISIKALPVYEIYKVGEDISWLSGLDFFRLYGLELIFIPHWNNEEGGMELDTSRCFMGRERFIRLLEMLPEQVTVIGLDEKTALIVDPIYRECRVSGLGQVTILHTGHKHTQNNLPHTAAEISMNIEVVDDDLVEFMKLRGSHIHRYQDTQVFSISELGSFHPFFPDAHLPSTIWQTALQQKNYIEAEAGQTPTEYVLNLIKKREEARQTNNWAIADELRKQIENLGWEISDTKDGPVSRKLPRTKSNI